MPRPFKLDFNQEAAFEVSALTGSPVPEGLVEELKKRHAAEDAAKKPAAGKKNRAPTTPPARKSVKPEPQAIGKKQ